ncbi:hypothetical protein HOU00_gp059 [Caulobacter phage CcrPW]|uniref:Uncharacterized protein n=1 Tax=Caulobacter phage CcrPW TaxID=2283271 RepID=A0A385ECY6_9CAUD|nr:hypothetical protein HOU00_gp059 [Caulobacter phage CcrPW]AXQ68598.1 hypothetical protein CcrPW_gp059 [Caulobacter phage CcrPW]
MFAEDHDDVHVSEHADFRVRKRMGIPRKAVDRMVTKALADGASHSAFSGSMKRYLDHVYLKEGRANNMKVHAGYLFLFAGSTLITCWPLPPKYRNTKPRA